MSIENPDEAKEYRDKLADKLGTIRNSDGGDGIAKAKAQGYLEGTQVNDERYKQAKSIHSKDLQVKNDVEERKEESAPFLVDHGVLQIPEGIKILDYFEEDDGPVFIYTKPRNGREDWLWAKANAQPDGPVSGKRPSRLEDSPLRKLSYKIVSDAEISPMLESMLKIVVRKQSVVFKYEGDWWWGFENEEEVIDNAGRSNKTKYFRRVKLKAK